MGKAILAFVPDGRLEEIIERIDFAPRGPNTLTDPGGVPGGAAQDPRVGHRRERRGARLRAAVDRRPDPLAVGRGLAALNLAVHRTMVAMDELIARFGPAVIRTARDISLSMGHR